MSKKFILLAGSILVIAALYAFLKVSPASSGFLWRLSSEGQWLLPLVAASAAIDSINPCALSILILTMGILFSASRMRSDIVKIGFAYVAGIFIVYLAIGLGILQVLHIFSTPHFMAKLGAWLMIALGTLNALQALFPAFPLKLQIPHVSHGTMAKLIQKGSLPAMFVLGAFVGLCEFPCTGGPYLAVLGLLRAQETMLTGLMYLLFYNAIFVLPLVLILLLASQKEVAESIRQWQQKNAKSMRLIAGSVMVGLGIIILKFFV